MKRNVIALCLLLSCPVTALAQTPPDAPAEAPGLMDRGIEMFLRGLADEVGPSLNDMQGLLKDMQPQLRELMDLIGDFRNYSTPERLPNGDILIRRKPDAPPVPPVPGTPDTVPPGTAPLPRDPLLPQMNPDGSVDL